MQPFQVGTGCSVKVVVVLTLARRSGAAANDRERTAMNECPEAGASPGERLLVLGGEALSEAGWLSWCTSGRI